MPPAPGTISQLLIRYRNISFALIRQDLAWLLLNRKTWNNAYIVGRCVIEKQITMRIAIAFGITIWKGAGHGC